MPGERVSMRKIREVLRLRFAQALSQRAIGVSLGLSTGAVNSYLGRARMVGLSWPLAEEFSDAELCGIIISAAIGTGRAAAGSGLGERARKARV
jgi:Sigma-70, region 4